MVVASAAVRCGTGDRMGREIFSLPTLLCLYILYHVNISSQKNTSWVFKRKQGEEGNTAGSSPASIVNSPFGHG